METLKKTCEKHGELHEDDIIKENSNQYSIGYYLRCRKCALEQRWNKEGRRCKNHGLLSIENIKANGRCKLCHRESANKKRNENREWFNKKIAEDKKKNPEKWKNVYKRAYENQIKYHGSEIRNTKEIIRMHGLTHEQYETMFKKQNNRCAICFQEETRKNNAKGTLFRLVVDHCHETKKVRALLCHSCNTGIGKFKEDIEIMLNAINYLEAHK